MNPDMSTFSTLLLILFLLIFGIRFFMYFMDIDMPLVSGLMTLLLLLMTVAEITLAGFELPAALIDLVVLISMGNRTIAICCGAVIVTVLLLICVVVFPRFHWKKILAFHPVKYAALGVVILSLAIYTELFNGSYSFRDLEEYNAFKQSFAQYDRHFWPTKFIRKTEDNGREIVTTYSVYPWDVEIDDGKQFAYKVVTFYSDEDNSFQYYPFTYNLYAGTEPRPVSQGTSGMPASPRVSGSDLRAYG